MKSEDGIPFTKGNPCIDIRAKRSESSNTIRSKNRSSVHIRAIARVSQILDIDSFSIDEIAVKQSFTDDQYPDLSQHCLDNCCNLIGEIDVQVEPHRPSLGNSDDEDVGVVFPLQRSHNSCRIERLASLLSSDDAANRAMSLHKLKNEIIKSLKHCPTPPELNFSAPYDERKIKLNENLSLVSDLAASYRARGDDDVLLMDHPSRAPEEPCIVKEEENADDDYLVKSKGQLQAIMDICGNSLFRPIADKSEKCRCLALDCRQSLLLAGIDLGKHVPYMIPAISTLHV